MPNNNVEKRITYESVNSVQPGEKQKLTQGKTNLESILVNAGFGTESDRDFYMGVLGNYHPVKELEKMSLPGLENLLQELLSRNII
jgi:hypothetical protein|tara:strand:+ start:792 stop:1049 length:258 start_codon:yes stop_codon:yes gene_type:complete